MTNSPFQLPDPSESQIVTHPTTGETWEYVNGVWRVSSETEDHTHQEFDDIRVISADDFNALLSANNLYQTLVNSITELNNEINVLENRAVLVLED